MPLIGSLLSLQASARNYAVSGPRDIVQDIQQYQNKCETVHTAPTAPHMSATFRIPGHFLRPRMGPIYQFDVCLENIVFLNVEPSVLKSRITSSHALNCRPRVRSMCKVGHIQALLQESSDQ